MADVLGIKLKNGYVSSLVLRYENRYVGHLSGIDATSLSFTMPFE
ncbi:hypothetical protein AB4Z45_32420 [Paenibacillus sp. MCAF9]